MGNHCQWIFTECLLCASTVLGLCWDSDKSRRQKSMLSNNLQQWVLGVLLGRILKYLSFPERMSHDCLAIPTTHRKHTCVSASLCVSHVHVLPGGEADLEILIGICLLTWRINKLWIFIIFWVNIIFTQTSKAEVGEKFP